MQIQERPLRNTHQRQLILGVVRGSPDHPTADKIYETAREQDGSISKGTVYRNLSLLSDLGEIRKLPMPFGPDHYDFNMENHYHFICRECNCVVDVDIPYNQSFNSDCVGLPGFETEWHRLILVGLCPSCKEKIQQQ